jgi:cytochrome d ubiquinol oxidase subunit II
VSAVDGLDLPVIWAVIIAAAVFMYVLLDGFDLGVGILFPFARDDADRDVMMNSVAPVWDGNETWLVLGGGGLLGTFPIAYAVLLEAFYLPLIVMLLALVYRGVAFEFRFKSRRNRHWWDRSFAWGSTVATFAQGVVLGTFIQGVEVVDGRYAAGAMEWLSPFSLACGAALVAGYALLGAAWLVLKTAGELQAWSRRRLRPLLVAVLLGIAMVSLWTPLIDARIMARWFTLPNLLYLSPVPLVVGLGGLALWRAAAGRSDTAPFLLAIGLFALAYAGLGISLWPYIVPPEITIWEAASPPASQGFMLVGVVVLLPLILGYTAWSYWVFRGKVTADQHYH